MKEAWMRTYGLMALILCTGLAACGGAPIDEDQAALENAQGGAGAEQNFFFSTDIKVTLQSSSATVVLPGFGVAASAVFKVQNDGGLDESNILYTYTTYATRSSGGENVARTQNGHGVISSTLQPGWSKTVTVNCSGADGWICRSISLTAGNPAGDDTPSNNTASWSL
jgi:hypothetical protein